MVATVATIANARSSQLTLPTTSVAPTRHQPARPCVVFLRTVATSYVRYGYRLFRHRQATPACANNAANTAVIYLARRWCKGYARRSFDPSNGPGNATPGEPKQVGARHHGPATPINFAEPDSRRSFTTTTSKQVISSSSAAATAVYYYAHPVSHNETMRFHRSGTPIDSKATSAHSRDVVRGAKHFQICESREEMSMKSLDKKPLCTRDFGCTVFTDRYLLTV